MRKTKLNLNKLAPQLVNEDPIKAFKQAQMALLAIEPFVATVMLNLHHQYNDDIPTAQTQGTKVEYNAQFFLNLSKKERIFLIAHETWHVILQHTSLARLGERNEKIWNIAGDYVINRMLNDQNLGKMPEPGLLSLAFNNMSTEEVYDEIKDSNIDEMLPNFVPDVIPKELDPDQQLEITQAIIQASEQLNDEQRSEMPDFIKEMLNKILRPQHDWKSQLREFVSARTKNDYSWSRPNRRMPDDIYLPSLFSETPETIVVAIDTSGSITTEELTTFLSEIKAIHEDVRPLNTVIFPIDTQVHTVYNYNEYDDIPTSIPMEGRGGTAFQPAFNEADKHSPSCMIYLTDLYAPDPKVPSFPTLWVSTTPHKRGPFGRTIYLKT
ncbi:MAG: hypothetical protein HOE82_08600 [Gammaproteobacteria bacterium]|jgi:predicted metal-dependent peptidase|nr:hypothetical protein [Gammaproteobacteria bacterium]